MNLGLEHNLELVYFTHLIQFVDPVSSHQMVWQLAQHAQIIPDYFSCGLVREVKRLFGNLPVARAVRRFQSETLPLKFRILKGLFNAPAPFSEKVVRHEGVSFFHEIHIAEVPLFGSF